MQTNENEKYYYDVCGRHVLSEDGNKVYQIGPCTSTYELGTDDLLHKNTVDCGHSEIRNPLCKMQLKDPNDLEILPTVEPVDIRS